VSDSGTGGPTSEATTTWTARHPALTYSLARLALFALLAVIVMVVTQNLFIALITAAILSSVISIFALRKQRDALSASIASRAQRASQKMAERSASEDSWDDAQRQSAEPDSDPGSDSDAGRL
jgi:hypothetical protein